MVLNILMRSLLPSRQPSLLCQAPVLASKILASAPHDDQANQSLANYVQTRGAARKYKRLERMRKLKANASKRRLEEASKPKIKKSFAHSIKVDKSQLRFKSEREQDAILPPPPEDNVYFYEKFRKPRYSLDEILDFHRQIAHPDVLDCPDSLVTATVELNLKMKIKKKRYIEKIESTVGFPHPFEYQPRPRKIVALCKNEADQEAAREAGACMAGSSDIALMLKSKQLTSRDFDHIVCHSDFLVEFAAVKGMKGHGFFPSKQRGNFGDDIVQLVKMFRTGLDYQLKKNEDDPSYGTIECHFGKLNMKNEQLQENLVELFNSIGRFRPFNLADNKQFFQRVAVTVPISEEMFLLKFWDLVDDYVDPDTILSEEEQEEKQKVQVTSTN